MEILKSNSPCPFVQALVSAHQRDVEDETQKERAAGSEAEGIVRQCRQRQAELEGLQETSQLLESHAQQRRQELEELQRNVTGDTGLLQELLDELARAEDDNLLLLQYSAQDASKIKVCQAELLYTVYCSVCHGREIQNWKSQ